MHININENLTLIPKTNKICKFRILNEFFRISRHALPNSMCVKLMIQFQSEIIITVKAKHSNLSREHTKVITENMDLDEMADMQPNLIFF